MKTELRRRILSLIYPVRCPVCGAFIDLGDGFCGDCAGTLKRYSGDVSIPGADGFFAPFEYTPEIKPAVMLMKDGIAGNAPYAFALALAECLRSAGIAGDADLIIPVPMSPEDKRRRGFNQSALIAKELGKLIGVQMRDDLIVKQRRTLPQKTLTKKQRQVNLSGAFELKCHSEIRDRKILLLDDVCTTGSTLAELTALLKNSGAAKVRCAACCKTPDKKEMIDNDI